MSFDPEEDDTTVPQDSQSSDASKPGFLKQFQEWNSKPENAAALLQFGISMLQPRSPGQSGIGQFANSIGEAGQASGRVQAQQRLDDQQEASDADKAAQRENQATVAGSGRITANAYANAVANGQGNSAGKGLSGALRVQQDFRKWLMKPDDQTGMTSDPIVAAVAKQFPNVKTKADLLSDNAARAAAMRLFAQQGTTEPNDDGTAIADPTAAPTSAPATPASPNPSYKMPDGRIITYDPVSRSYKYPDGTVAQ